tara:strand:- start:356 stop:529 length:174 start_codon:yes stop_codon:yes gene_type:complete
MKPPSQVLVFLLERERIAGKRFFKINFSILKNNLNISKFGPKKNAPLGAFLVGFKLN